MSYRYSFGFSNCLLQLQFPGIRSNSKGSYSTALFCILLGNVLHFSFKNLPILSLGQNSSSPWKSCTSEEACCAPPKHKSDKIYVGFAWEDLTCKQETLFSSVASSCIEVKISLLFGKFGFFACVGAEAWSLALEKIACSQKSCFLQDSCFLAKASFSNLLLQRNIPAAHLSEPRQVMIA